MSRKKGTSSKHYLTALVANAGGEIFELEGYAAVGMSDSELTPLTVEGTRRIPYGSELMYLPQRKPVLWSLERAKLETVGENPYVSGERLFPVAAFNSPGFVLTSISAYRETADARTLPLFAYGAVGWGSGGFRTAVFQVDPEPRQDLRRMKREDVVAGVKRMRGQMPRNRLRRHLEKCALEYGCPAGKNFFLGRYEAPLPASSRCNARCRGCLSSQPGGSVPHSQNRIAFTPSSEEISEIALAHIRRVPRGVVSFGQGCEGDPLLALDTVESAVRRIRSITGRGTINVNTNGSLPAAVERLVDAGLDSIRISINSVRPECYTAYFRPRGYAFEQVLKSIDLALDGGLFVAINYLNLPGFTDTPEESETLRHFLERYPIHMIQWRNLNYDPLRYWRLMNRTTRHGRPIGMKKLLAQVHATFPEVRHGYFNPPKGTFHVHHENTRRTNGKKYFPAGKQRS